jgi:anti-sigma factor RsiW
MVNRDQVIAYLLHEMPEDEREAFGERWFTDPELSEDLRMTEADLLDAYVRGKVSAERRKKIERWLLGSPTQGQKLDFARALAKVVPDTAPRRIPWALLGAVAAGLALLASLAMLMVHNRQLESELARVEAQGRALVQARPTGAVYAIFLPADTLRSGAGISVSLPQGADVVHLQLGLETGQQRDFDSAVVSVSGRAVWRQQPVSAASLWIPAKLLGPGNYTVRLDSNGTPVAYYSFTVLR